MSKIKRGPIEQDKVVELESTRSAPAKERRPGIYLLPNLFTTGAMFAGFYAIVAAMNDRFVAAAIAIVVAGVLDGLDGRIARLTNSQSDFGVEYDSMSDLVSFGLAPALIIYLWSLSHLAEISPVLGKLGWLAAFLYAVCAALRLARFNTQIDVVDKGYFQGLASPAAAGLLISTLWVCHDVGLDGPGAVWLALPVTIAAALLMVSNVRYYSFKKLPERISFFWLVLLVGLLIFFALDFPKALALICYGFAVSGLVITSRGVLAGRRRREDPDG